MLSSTLVKFSLAVLFLASDLACLAQERQMELSASPVRLLFSVNAGSQRTIPIPYDGTSTEMFSAHVRLSKPGIPIFVAGPTGPFRTEAQLADLGFTIRRVAEDQTSEHPLLWLPGEQVVITWPVAAKVGEYRLRISATESAEAISGLLLR
jgi:hypothetical protein